MNHKNLVLHGALLGLIAMSLGAYASISSAESIDGLITTHDRYISIQGRNATSAIITASGNLRIADVAIPLSASQRLLTQRYYDQVRDIMHEGLETGKIGVITAGKIIATVAFDLVSGHPDRIDRTTHQQVAKITRHVTKICDDLQSIQTTQNRISAEIPAFTPYTVINKQQLTDCRPAALSQ